MRLPPLYHWSPQSRREAIRSEGLKPYSPPAVSMDPSSEWAHGFGCVCLGLSASAAWGLSGDLQHLTDEAWDLWQVGLADSDEVRIRAEFGPKIQEVRVFNPIPADRIWWVGQRP
jgi:hypothetical protein